MHHCWILPEHPQRQQVESFICERYWLNFNACLLTLPRLLIAVFDDTTGGKPTLVAACGVQFADEQPLFSQIYLNQPLANYRIQNKAMPMAERLAEVGSMAALAANYLPHLFQAVVKLLRNKQRTAIIFTATRALQKYFRRMGVALTTLEIANSSALPASWRSRWGNYYQHQPVVLGGWLAQGDVFEQVPGTSSRMTQQVQEVAL